MQTFTMQFPVTSTVTVGNDGSITITPAAPAPTHMPADPAMQTLVDFAVGDDKAVFVRDTAPQQTPSVVEPAAAEPVHADDGFRQLPNVRVHGGNVSLARTISGGVAGSRVDTLETLPMLVGGYAPKYQSIVDYVATLPVTTAVDAETFTPRNIHFGVKTPWGKNKFMLTVNGVLLNPTGQEDHGARIAVLRYNAADKTLYAAFHPGVSAGARKVLLTALRGGKVMKHVMGKVLLSAGRGQ